MCDPTAEAGDQALCRSVMYATLAAAFRPPTVEGGERLEGSRPLLLDAARAIDGRAGRPGLTLLVQELVASLSGWKDLVVAHQRLFGHTAHGAVPPYETEYGHAEAFQQSQDLADIAGFYRAFGLTLEPARRERIDHVSVECEFLSFLCCKEARELQSGDAACCTEVRKAQKLFLRDHLGRFGRSFARALAKAASHPFHRHAGQLCFEFLTAECAFLDVPPGPEFIALAAQRELEVPMACSSCTLEDHE
ncbi:MAG: molecular chaperone TorD family protein [Planctomycetota bacterium]